MRLFVAKALLGIFGTLFVLGCISQADARAGGGSSSRSSSSSSRSSSSSSSSYGNSSSSFRPGVWYVSTGGWSGGVGTVVVIIIIVIVIVVVTSKRKWVLWGQDDSYEPIGEPVQVNPVSDLPEKISALKAIDPGFNEWVFEDRVSTAFFKIQDAWCKQDMNIGRAFVTDSVLRRFNMQLEEYRQNKTRNKLEWLTLNNVETLDIVLDNVIERIDVHVTASAKDYIVDEAGKYVSGNNTQMVTWDEKWSFVRTAGVKTDAEKSVFSEKCPNCGAPLKVDSTGECEYCRSNITTGKFDWVLSEITQLNV